MTMSNDVTFPGKQELVQVMAKIGLSSFEDMKKRVQMKIDAFHDMLVGKEFKRYDLCIHKFIYKNLYIYTYIFISISLSLSL